MTIDMKSVLVAGSVALALSLGPMIASADAAGHRGGGGGHGGGGHGGGGFHRGGGFHGGGFHGGGRRFGGGHRFGGYGYGYRCGPIRLAAGLCRRYGY